MKRLIALAIISCLATSCGLMVSEDKAIEALEAEGWTEVQITSRHWISPNWVGGCAKDDRVAFSASGQNPAKKATSAIVCCNLVLKGCTIRH